MTLGALYTQYNHPVGQNITDVYVENSTPSIIAPFSSKTYMEATLHVPLGSLQEYAATNGWKEFWNVKEETTRISNVLIDESDKIETFDILGRKITNCKQGNIYIRKNKNGYVKKIVIR